MSSVEKAKSFVGSWNDPELRRFAEEYAAEQTLGFAQLAIDQAEQIKRLQDAVKSLLGDFNDADRDIFSERHVGQGEFEPYTVEDYGLTEKDMNP